MSNIVRPTVVVVAASMLLVVSCGGGDGDGDDAGSSTTESAIGGDPAATTEPATTDGSDTSTPATSDAAVTTEPSASSTVPSTVPPVDDGGCLVGDWVVDEAQMNAYYAGLMSTLDAPLNVTVVGSAPLSFDADGTYDWAPTFDLVVEIAGQSGVGSTAGTITGNWTAADGVMTATSETNSIELSITIGSTTVNGSDLANGLLNSSPVDGVTYSCAGPTPVIDFKTADPAVTVPVTLTPA